LFGHLLKKYRQTRQMEILAIQADNFMSSIFYQIHSQHPGSIKLQKLQYDKII